MNWSLRPASEFPDDPHVQSRLTTLKPTLDYIRVRGPAGTCVAVDPAGNIVLLWNQSGQDVRIKFGWKVEAVYQQWKPAGNGGYSWNSDDGYAAEEVYDRYDPELAEKLVFLLRWAESYSKFGGIDS